MRINFPNKFWFKALGQISTNHRLTVSIHTCVLKVKTKFTTKMKTAPISCSVITKRIKKKKKEKSTIHSMKWPLPTGWVNGRLSGHLSGSCDNFMPKVDFAMSASWSSGASRLRGDGGGGEQNKCCGAVVPVCVKSVYTRVLCSVSECSSCSSCCCGWSPYIS